MQVLKRNQKYSVTRSKWRQRVFDHMTKSSNVSWETPGTPGQKVLSQHHFSSVPLSPKFVLILLISWFMTK